VQAAGLGKTLARASTVGKPFKAYKPHQAARLKAPTEGGRRFSHARVSSKNNPSKPTKPTKPARRYHPVMIVFVVIVAALALLALLGGLVTFTYLCAMASGRVLGWVLHVEDDQPAREVD
jgi:hypothetical protein